MIKLVNSRKSPTGMVAFSMREGTAPCLGAEPSFLYVVFEV